MREHERSDASVDTALGYTSVVGTMLAEELANAEDQVALGAKGHLPRGYIEDTLRFFKQFTQTVSRGYMLSSFTMYPPL